MVCLARQSILEREKFKILRGSTPTLVIQNPAQGQKT